MTKNKPLTGKLCRLSGVGVRWNLYINERCNVSLEIMPPRAMVMVIKILPADWEMKRTVAPRSQVIYGETIGWVYTDDFEVLDGEE